MILSQNHETQTGLQRCLYHNAKLDIGDIPNVQENCVFISVDGWADGQMIITRAHAHSGESKTDKTQNVSD